MATKTPTKTETKTDKSSVTKPQTKSLKPVIEKTPKTTEGNIAIIRIRSFEDSKYTIRDTMKMLRLYKKHTCAVYPNTPVIRGMLDKCKDYVTYGELDAETYKLLVDKRGVTKEGKTQNYFYLAPPRGGFERRGIKAPFAMKGALGYRGVKINDLIKKMI